MNRKTTKKNRAPAGGSFLLEPSEAHEILIPEDFDEELGAIAKTAEEFSNKEVVPRAREMESKEGKAEKVPITLLRKAAELGFCGIDVPEEYGGFDLGIIASMLVTEKLAGEGAFSVTFGAHTGIGTLPITFFGTPEQKAKYLPASATAEKIHAYCLTEPGSGSDALGARTKAVLNEAGTHYVLNGTKMWISNGAWADVYVIFAQVDGDKFTGFIVERDFPGVSAGPEEHKLGLRGSSTTTVNLDNAEVPVENVLGEIGKGHKIAFSILNVGRFKLGAGVTGGMKNALDGAIGYAHERKQFGKAIVNFGAMKQKIADMATRIWVSEAMCYRLGGYMEASIEGIAKDDPDREAKKRAVIEEYAIESSVAKVWCSEALDFVIDESLQMYGGSGFVEDYPIEKAYRDARVNRIFEGTSEINRMLIPGMLLKRAMKGKLPLMGAGQALAKELAEAERFEFPDGDLLEKTAHAVELLKKLSLHAYASATQRFMMDLKNEQQVLMSLADLAIETYAADSAYARAAMLVERGELELDSAQVAAAALYAADALDKARTIARNVLTACWEGDKLGTWLAGLAKLDVAFDVNRVALRRAVAKPNVDKERYALSTY